MKKSKLKSSVLQITALLLFFAMAFGITGAAAGLFRDSAAEEEDADSLFDQLFRPGTQAPSDGIDDPSNPPTSTDRPTDPGTPGVSAGYLQNLSNAFNTGLIQGYLEDRTSVSLTERAKLHSLLTAAIATVDGTVSPVTYQSYTGDGYQLVRKLHLNYDYTAGTETIIRYSKQYSNKDASYIIIATPYLVGRKTVQSYMGYLLISRVEYRQIAIPIPPSTEDADPPVTTPPTTEEPITTPPTTNEPVTTPPTTGEPITNPPITDTPTTNLPITNPPVTGEPTTNPPATGDPIPDVPITVPDTTTVPETGAEPEAPVTPPSAEPETPVTTPTTEPVNPPETTPAAGEIVPDPTEPAEPTVDPTEPTVEPDEPSNESSQPSSAAEVPNVSPQENESEAFETVAVTVLSIYDRNGNLLVDDIGSMQPHYARDYSNRPVFKDADGKLYAFDGKKFLETDQGKLRTELSYDYPAYPLGEYKDIYEAHYNEATDGYHYINYKNGGSVVTANYRYAFNFGPEGYAIILTETDNFLQIINRRKSQIFKPGKQYTFYTDPTTGKKQYVKDFYAFPSIMGIESIGAAGFDHGYLRLRIKTVSMMSDSIGKVVLDKDYLVNTSGEKFNIPEGCTLEGYSDGILLLRTREGLYGYYSIEGDWIAQPLYTYARPFVQGLAVLGSADGTVGMIDTKGNIVLPFVFTSIEDVSSGLIVTYCEGVGYETYELTKK